MEFLKTFISILSVGAILIIIGKFLKDRFIKVVGIIICTLTIGTPCIGFLLGFIDAFK